MAVHGDVIEITVNHPTLGSKSLFPKANETCTYDLGGFRNEDDANMITGNGSLMTKKNRQHGFFEVVIEIDQNVREDLEYLRDLAASPVKADFTYQMVNDAIYTGKGEPVGDLQPDANAGTMTLKVVAPSFKKISG
jgi:hypothetical protein